MTTFVNPKNNISLNNSIFKESGKYQWERIVETSAKGAWNNVRSSIKQISFVIYDFEDLAICEKEIHYSSTPDTHASLKELNSKMKEYAPTRRCFYILLNFYYELEGKLRNKKILILWAPDNTASVQQKMLSASMFVMYVKKYEETCSCPFVGCNINDEGDLNYNFLLELCLKKGPHQAVELDFGERMQKVCETNLFDTLFIF
jgi:hypothetical protein